MYVYLTSTFETELSKQSGVRENFEKFCREIEMMEIDRVFSRFDRIYPYLKRKEHNLRLIARVRRVGHEQVLCWLAIFKRGDRDYEIFLRDRQLKSSLNERDLREWLKAQQENASKPLFASTAPPLDESLLPWLERPDWTIDRQGSIVCESQVWIERIAAAAIQDNWEVFNRAIAILADATTALGQETPHPGLYLYSDEGCSILYRKITTLDRPARQVLFLLAPFSATPSNAEISQILASICGGEDSGNGTLACLSLGLTLDELTPLAYRAYPSYLLADEESWYLLEREPHINLALSAEEEGILHRISTRHPSLPLFLNGQAGSGKSTLLFHLFADYCYRHFDYAKAAERDFFAAPHPLFLAYNDRLLEVAQKRVTSLLSAHHRFLARRSKLEPLPNISPFFRTFRPFFRGFLPPSERDRFPNANYVSFYRFRQLLQAQMGDRFSPERCWQVIRTFIKGYHLDERNHYLDRDEYAEIPKKERTVSEAEFAAIYNLVWPWYKKYCEDHQLWDDQDLIRRVLILKCYRPEYTAIFCDEAQDFTPLELRSIVRLSVFSNYDLERQYVPCLPFVFAGDPLQTLNPTGFRWESLKAAFYNEAIATLSPTAQSGLEMNFAELEYNYRSFPAIVGANNLVQLWRSVLFEMPEIKPQQARKRGIFKPQKLILGENIDGAALKERLQDAIILIPTDEGGEKEYVKQDELLKELTGAMEGDRCPWNVLSATAAKGLEFKQVIIYKFGEACPPHLWEGDETSIEEKKYFLNKLYVAMSRATERLIIVDTVGGEEQLWRWASNPAEIEIFLQRKPVEKQRHQWHGKLHSIELSDGLELFKVDELPAIAEIFRRQGMETQNPESLRRAQGAYRRLQDEQQAASCEAFALQYEGKFLEAGRQFLALKALERAWDCFWNGAGWQEMKDLAQTYAGTESFSPDPFQLRLVNFLARPERDRETLEEFGQFLWAEVGEGEIAERCYSLPWQAAIAAFTEGVKTFLHRSQCSQIPPTQWQSWGELFARLETLKSGTVAEVAGDCFYRAKDYDRALQEWGDAAQIQKNQYHIAKVRILGFPAGLNYLLDAQQYNAILRLWQRKNRPSTVEWLKVVAPAFEAKGHPLAALMLYSQAQDLTAAKNCFERAFFQDNLKALKYYLYALLQHE